MFSPLLSQQRLYHFAVNVGEAKIAPLEPIGQPGMVQTEQVENRRVQIVNVDFVFDGVKSQFICFAVNEARLDTAAGEPHGVTVWMMVAPNLVGFGFALHHGRASEFTTPDDQRFIQQPAFL